MSSRSPIGCLSALLALTGSCDAGTVQHSPGDDDVVPTGPWVRLGSGFDTFEELADGDDIHIIAGPQGGYHVFGSVRAAGIVPGDPADFFATDNPTSTYRVFDAAGARVDLMQAVFVAGLPAGSTVGTFESVGNLVVLDIERDDALGGETVRFEVAIVDVEGTTVTDSRSLRPVPHPDNP